MKAIVISICLIISHSTLLYSINYHVQPKGKDTNNGLSFSTAFLTIQAATNIVKAGDTVMVYDGYYKGFDHFYKANGTAKQAIVYFAKGSAVIVNASCGRGFDGINIEGSHYIHLIGFKVQRISDPVGNGEDGIRAVLADHIHILNCEVDSCYRGIFTGYTDDFVAVNNICKRSYGEHGIYVSNNSDRVLIENNICYNNKAAGIQLNPDLSSGSPGISIDVKIYNNICYNNRIGLNLQGIYNSEVVNNLIYNNGSGNGGNGMTFFLGDAATGCNNVKVFNNTVIVPSGSQWAILAIESDSLFMYNNILLSLSPKGCLDIESSCTNYFSDFNLLSNKMTQDQGSSYFDFITWQNKGFDKNSMMIPNIADVFNSLVTNDYHLTANSKARNSGSNIVSQLVTTDLDNLKRPQGSAYDIGCYEFKESNTSIIEHDAQSLTYYIDGSYIFFNGINDQTPINIHCLQGHSLTGFNPINTSMLSSGVYYFSIYDPIKQEHYLNKIFINKK